MQSTTTKTLAEMIAVELEDICVEEALSRYANDASGHDSLEYHESLVRTRLGGSYDASAWEGAMDIIRERYAGEA